MDKKRRSFEDSLETVEDILYDAPEQELLEETAGKPRHRQIDDSALFARNVLVFSAAILFIVSFFTNGESMHYLRAGGYFLGAGAYLSELVLLTDGFSKSVPRREAFMAYCFGPLYIAMGIAYLLG